MSLSLPPGPKGNISRTTGWICMTFAAMNPLTLVMTPDLFSIAPFEFFSETSQKELAWNRHTH